MNHAYPSVLRTISFFLLFYLLILGVGYCCARSRSMTQSTVGLLRTSIVPHAQTSTWQHATLTTNRPPCPRRVSNSQSSKRVTADPRHALDHAAIRIDYVHHAYRISSGWLTFWHRNYFFNFSTPCIQNVNKTGTKYVRIMKQTAFWRERDGEYIPCLKYSVTIFVIFVE